MSNTSDLTPLTDYRLAAAATAVGGHLEDVTEDLSSSRLVFHFTGLSPTFMQDVFNGTMVVPVRDFISALEHVNSLIFQYKARKRRV